LKIEKMKQNIKLRELGVNSRSYYDNQIGWEGEGWDRERKERLRWLGGGFVWGKGSEVSTNILRYLFQNIDY
jgi:hypothetical protein